MSKPLVIQVEDLEQEPASWLAERVTLERCAITDQPRFDALLAQAQGLVVRTYTRVDAALLARAPRLRVVGRGGVGLDRIDVAECLRRDVQVVYTPDANSDAVAEYVFALLFDALRPRLFLDRPISSDRWNTLRRELQAKRQLNELTLGIVGLGRIGARIARIAAAFGCRTLYHDLRDIPEHERRGAKSVSLDRLLAESDVVTLHVDPRPANRHLCSDAFLRAMKPSAILINTSRGMMVDAAALARWLSANPSATALIDVHDPEPFDASYPLLGLPNAHLAPHAAACTRTAHTNMSWVVRDVVAVLEGRPPTYPASLSS